ncbi:Pentatricopeptide repeat-containing protein [Nymphaea thermarum]|nr:Pentatricopeptide repeat-containing protein [Nymphaea thermarum]
MFKPNRKLFSRGLASTTHSNLSSCSTRIKSYIQQGLYQEALKLYYLANSLHHIKADRFIVPSILKACSSLSDQDFGKRILKLGLDIDVYISYALISFYVNFNGLVDACQVFDDNRFLKEMQTDRYSLSITLGCRDDCPDLQCGKQVHAFVVQNTWGDDQFLVIALIDMYAKCAVLADAWQVFNKAAEMSTKVWNAMISGFVINGMWENGLEMCKLMHIDGVDFGSSAFSIVLQACSQEQALLSGMKIHSLATRMSYERHPHVSTSILTMYMKCLQVDDARQLFDLIRQKESASWNVIILGYSYNGYDEEGLMMFASMRSKGIQPYFSAISTVLAACVCSVEFIDFGKAVHGDAVKRAAYLNIVVQSVLLTIYAKCGLVDAAEYIFNKIEARDQVSCCSMVVGFCQNNRFKEAFGVFELMRADSVKPDSMVMVCLLTACSGMEDVQSGLQVHALVTKSSFASDVYVGTALIDMYAKCRSPDLAGFMPMKNLVSWNTIISAYAKNNHPGESINLFAELSKYGLKPNSISVTSVMAATASLAAIL